MIKHLAAVLVFTLSPPLFAQGASALYEANLYVTAQTANVRLEAEKQGLAQVLIRISGEPEAIHNQVVRDAFKDAESYVQEFSYSPTNEVNQFQIMIRYTKKDINNLLRKANLPISTTERPQLMVWLATTKKDQTDIVNDDNNAIAESLKESARKYAFPLIFPLMDVTELNDVKPEYILNFDKQNLMRVSERYAPDGYLVGKITILGDKEFDSHWQFFTNKQELSWDAKGSSLDELFEQSFQQIMMSIAPKKATRNMANLLEDSWLKLEVNNVTERLDLARLLAYLHHTNTVKKVQLSEVEGDIVRVTVLVQGDMDSFIQQAGLGKQMILKSQNVNANMIVYEWLHSK